MVAIGDELTIEITSLASTGKGVGILEVDGFKRSVFVPLTVTGDVCDIKITAIHKKYYEAELLGLQKFSIHRVTPSCSHFGECGACDWLHISYSYQLEAKKNILLFLLSRANIKHPSIKIVSSEHPFHYRHKIKVLNKEGVFGFYKRKSNDIVAIKNCSIIRNEFNDALFNTQHILNDEDDKTSYALQKENVETQQKSKEIISRVQRFVKDGEYIFLFDNGSNAVVSDEKQIAHYLYEDITYSYDMNSFIQSNLYQNEQLISCVLDLVPKDATTILELYCGIGNFTLPLARRVTRVVAVEGNAVAIDFLKQNMKNNAIENIDAFVSDVREFVNQENTLYDCILLDPPRSGMGEDISVLVEKTNVILYVSCDPTFLMKDLKILLSRGFFIENISLVDMFSQTHHFETVVLLKR